MLDSAANLSTATYVAFLIKKLCSFPFNDRKSNSLLSVYHSNSWLCKWKKHCSHREVMQMLAQETEEDVHKCLQHQQLLQHHGFALILLSYRQIPVLSFNTNCWKIRRKILIQKLNTWFTWSRPN